MTDWADLTHYEPCSHCNVELATVTTPNRGMRLGPSCTRRYIEAKGIDTAGPTGEARVILEARKRREDARRTAAAVAELDADRRKRIRPQHEGPTLDIDLPDD